MDTPTRIGRYEIIEELGRGAMGVVYRAKDPAMDRIVALKTIITVALEGPQGQEFRDRFFREARTAGALTHPGIVSMFDVGEHEGQPYLVMEFVSGPTLSEFARTRGRLSTDRICELGAQIAQALGFAHQRGVVHRDIKPANILITSGQAHGIERPKITDFGVAKLAEQHTTMTGQMVGTPAFMPPEQFTGTPIDGRSDIFSLGVVLYWLATGEQPFPGESITSISYKVVNAEPIPPRKLNLSLPARFDAAIMKCLAKSPADRFQNAEDLASELSEVRKPGATQPIPATMAFDPDATLVSAPAATTASTAVAAAVSPAAPPRPVVAQAGKRKNSLMAIAAAVAVAFGLAGWFAMRSAPSEESVASPTSAVVRPDGTTLSIPAAGQPLDNSPSGTPAAPSAAATPKPTAATTKPVNPTPPPAPPAADASVPTAVPAKSAASKNGGPATPAKPVPVNFDPKALDRRENARLDLDASRMPAALNFRLEMNDRIYFEKTGPEVYKKDGDLYVPPGVHEFRVVATEAGITKESNTVSTDFKANKRNSLKIELRIMGKSADAGMPNGLYPDSQLVLTLK